MNSATNKSARRLRAVRPKLETTGPNRSGARRRTGRPNSRVPNDSTASYQAHNGEQRETKTENDRKIIDTAVENAYRVIDEYMECGERWASNRRKRPAESGSATMHNNNYDGNQAFEPIWRMWQCYVRALEESTRMWRHFGHPSGGVTGHNWGNHDDKHDQTWGSRGGEFDSDVTWESETGPAKGTDQVQYESEINFGKPYARDRDKQEEVEALRLDCTFDIGRPKSLRTVCELRRIEGVDRIPEQLRVTNLEPMHRRAVVAEESHIERAEDKETVEEVEVHVTELESLRSYAVSGEEISISNKAGKLRVEFSIDDNQATGKYAGLVLDTNEGRPCFVLHVEIYSASERAQ